VLQIGLDLRTVNTAAAAACGQHRDERQCSRNREESRHLTTSDAISVF
jgi:hypothetical protein